MNLTKFLEEINYQFQNQALLQEALTHPSFASKDKINYQRLEFLGDAILGLVIAEILIKKYPKANEGELSKRQSYLISGEILAEIALSINLGDVMKFSHGEELIGGKNNKRNLENALEALIGAIYLDSGLINCQRFIANYWQKSIDHTLHPAKDSVSLLQEFTQFKSKKLPIYHIEKTDGNSHQPIFTATLCIEDKQYSASGGSKKEAQKNVATLAIKDLDCILPN